MHDRKKKRSQYNASRYIGPIVYLLEVDCKRGKLDDVGARVDKAIQDDQEGR